jgi:hypothetical protein
MRVLAFIVVIFCTACNNYQSAKGFVLDKSTKNPIDSVRISTFIEPDSPGLNQLMTFSRTNGSFQLTGKFGQTSDRSQFVVFFSKGGYRQSTVQFIGGSFSDTVYLERQ